MVQEDPGTSIYYIDKRVAVFGPTATWGGDGLTSNQSSYTVSGSQDFFINYTTPKKTTVISKSSTATSQTGTYNFTTTSTTTITKKLTTSRSGAIIMFDDNLSNENKDNPIYIDKRQYVILQKRILY